ncbi:MAG: BREX-4 system phosphatase PglZ, partial [Thermoplasmata archaeon]
MPIEKEVTLSYEEFKRYVEEDSHKPERFISRFICVENIEIWKKISEYLRKNGFEQIKASDLAKSNDVLPNAYELIESIRQSKPNSFLPSASEILTLHKASGSKFIKDVAMIETSEAFYLDGKKTYPRIYLLMLIDNEVLKSILNEIKRYKEGELYPILKVTAEDLYNYSEDASTVSIVFANFYTNSPYYKRIDGLKEYFNLWDELKIQLNAKIWVYTERTACLQILKPTTTDLKCYSSAYDFLSDKLKFSAPQESDTEENWKWLAEKYEDEATIEDLIKKIFNVQNFDPKDILGRWKTLDKKEKWLALQWPLPKPDESSYLYFIFYESKTAEEFEINAWIRIFDYLKKGNLNQEVISERAELLKKAGLNNPPKEFWNYYNELKNEKEKLLVLPCISESEKNEAIRLFGHLLANEEVSEIAEILKAIFEDLWAYIFYKPEIYIEASAKEKSLSFIDEYLLAYKTSRIKDTVEPKIKELLEEWNNGFIWSFTSRFQIIQELKNHYSHFVWVDGLGIEWLSLLAYYLTKEKNLKLTIKIGRANLPTITSTNSIEHNGLSSDEVLTLGRHLD